MFFLVSIPPAIGMLLSAIPTLKYAMSDKEHTQILNELIARRASKNAPKDEGELNTKQTLGADEDAAKILDDNMESIVDEINKLD